ncbi:hypothetical protein GW916_06235 [bacterium]|nr:hypothetical protein [bacterium]
MRFNLLLIFLFFPCVVLAKSSVIFGYAGFFGSQSVGYVHDVLDSHEAELSVGRYSRGHSLFGYQVNFSYRYHPWLIRFDHFSWSPLEIGAFGIYSLEKTFFLSSPSKYPTPDYYEQTAFRWGIENGASLLFFNERLSLGVVTRLIDSGMVAIYNNSNRDLQYYLSSGFRLEYRF